MHRRDCSPACCSAFHAHAHPSLPNALLLFNVTAADLLEKRNEWWVPGKIVEVRHRLKPYWQVSRERVGQLV